MKKNRLIPFRLTPASWGLSGPAYDEAEVAYYYEGEELERRLIAMRNLSNPTEKARQDLALDLRLGQITPYQHDLRLLEIDGRQHDRRAKLDVEMKHAQISEYDYAHGLIELDLDGIERDVAKLDLDLRHRRLTKREHAKAVATAKGEPWVGIVDDEFDLNLSISGFAIELDWNEYWVTYLRLAGFTGANDEEVVDQWFMAVCRDMVGEGSHYGDEAPMRGANRNERDMRTDYT